MNPYNTVSSIRSTTFLYVAVEVRIRAIRSVASVVMRVEGTKDVAAAFEFDPETAALFDKSNCCWSPCAQEAGFLIISRGRRQGNEFIFFFFWLVGGLIGWAAKNFPRRLFSSSSSSVVV